LLKEEFTRGLLAEVLVLDEEGRPAWTAIASTSGSIDPPLLSRMETTV
jgi:hypothetical protein